MAPAKVRLSVDGVGQLRVTVFEVVAMLTAGTLGASVSARVVADASAVLVSSLL